MQGSLHFSQEERYAKQEVLLQRFVRDKDAHNLLICVNKAEDVEFVTNFFTKLDAILFNVKQVIDPKNYLSGVGGRGIIVTNIDGFLSDKNALQNAGFLKQLIDEADSSFVKLIFVVYNEDLFAIVEDLLSRVKSFNRISFDIAN